MGKWSKISETVPGRELLEQNRVRHDVTIYRPQNYNLKTIVKKSYKKLKFSGKITEYMHKAGKLNLYE